MTINIVSQSDITDRSRMIQGHMTEMVYFHWSIMLRSSACRFVCLYIPKITDTAEVQINNRRCCWWLFCLSNVTKILEVTICSRTRRGSMPIPSASKKNFARRNKTAVWGRGDMLRLFSKLRIWGPIDMKESKYMLNNEMIAFLVTMFFNKCELVININN